jgi:hypothetical protein
VKRNSGQTLVEMLVGFVLLTLLMAGMFFIYQIGANAWKKGETQGNLVQTAQVFLARLGREVERSDAHGATLDPGPATGTAVAILSCYDPVNQRDDFDPNVRSPIWHSYQIFYYDSATRQVLLREVPLPAPTTVASPLAGLAALRTGGRTLARDVDRCDFTLSPNLLDVRLEMNQKRYGSQAPEHFELPGRMAFRN